MSTLLTQLYPQQPWPLTLEPWDWEDMLDEWSAAYRGLFAQAEILEVTLPPTAFLFDMCFERVCLAYAVSTVQDKLRNASRMSGYLSMNKAIQKELGVRAFNADRGHFVGHANGGAMDINLFPQRRELNRGWSEEGKRFREMEAYACARPGTLFFHRPIYDDETLIPAELEYGVLAENKLWWIERFRNKPKTGVAKTGVAK
jgi:hypothetical protein